MSNNKFTTFNLSEELKQQLAFKDDFGSMVTRMERAESKNLEQELRLEYLEGRQGNVKDAIIDLFMDGTRSNNKQTEYSKEVKEMFDIGENFTWKPREGSELWTQGIIRNDDQHYMLEVIDEYNLEGVGQAYKCAMKYDSINNCYWMMSNAGLNAIGEITKLSTNMKDGKVEILGRWYIPASGVASSTYVGLCSDGSYLYFCLYVYASNTSRLYKVKINSDGTLGKSGYTKKNGESLADTHANLILNTTLEWNIQDTNTGTIDDIIDYSDIEIAYLFCNQQIVTLKFLAKSNGGTGTTSTLTGLGNYIGGSHYGGRTLDKKDNILYVKIDDVTDDKRFIYKFDLTTDVVSNAFIKSSGRFENVRNVDGDGNEGICFSHDGHLLEVVSTASNGKFIAKRAIKNALWAENQVCGEKKMIGIVPTTPHSCMVTSDGAYWTGDYIVTSEQCKLIRYDIDGTKHALTLTGASITGIRDLTTDGTTVWMILYNGTNWRLCYTSYATLKSVMDALADGATGTYSLTSYATFITAYDSNASLISGICYDIDSNLLYILNDGTDKIDTLPTTLSSGTIPTAGVYDLPSSTSSWIGIAYKNENIYVGNFTDTTSPNRIFVIPKNKANATAMWRSHIYQDPSAFFQQFGAYTFDFDGDDIVTMNRYYTSFYKMKVLEDPDVMQLHTFIDRFNILIGSSPAEPTLASCGNVTCCTPIVERYFEPEDFVDIRDCPDKNYMAVGYGDEGFSILHLDKFLSGRSSTGKPRYDVRDIRIQHYKNSAVAGNRTTIASSGNILCCNDYYTRSIIIEKDMIYIARSGWISPLIDLKSGRVTAFNQGNTQAGWTYKGTLSERNDSKGWNDTYNSSLDMSTHDEYSVTARTFFKDDASDYNYENPKTYFFIGNATGGDIIVVDWDKNGNKSINSVYNNIFGGGTAIGQYSNYIASSGYIFGCDYGATYGICTLIKYESSITNNIPIYIWEVDNDGSNSNGVFRKVLSTSVENNHRNISPNSYCWKTASGQWRHRLVLATASAGFLELYDVENNINEKITQLTGYNHYAQCDNFEDKVFAVCTYRYDVNNTRGIFIGKKLKFNDKRTITDPYYYYNNWSSNYTFDTRLPIQILDQSRPYFTAWAYNVAGFSEVCRYAKKQGMLIVGSTITGLQGFLFPVMNQCKHVSTEIASTAQDVSEVYYKEYTVEG